MDRMTDTCKNITFATSLRMVIKLIHLPTFTSFIYDRSKYQWGEGGYVTAVKMHHKKMDGYSRKPEKILASTYPFSSSAIGSDKKLYCKLNEIL